MTVPPAAPQPGNRAGRGVLRELENAAAVKRAARQRIADAVAHPSGDTAELAWLRRLWGGVPECAGVRRRRVRR